MKYKEVKLFARALRNNQTSSERILWEHIRDRKIEGYKFIRQHPILVDRQGNDLNFFIPDFFCPKAKLIIEIDGPVHDQQKTHDTWREEILKRKNLLILRFTNEQLKDIDKVVQIISQTLRSQQEPSPTNKLKGQR